MLLYLSRANRNSLCCGCAHGERCPEETAPLWSRAEPDSRVQAPAWHSTPDPRVSEGANHKPGSLGSTICPFRILHSAVRGNFSFNKHLLKHLDKMVGHGIDPKRGYSGFQGAYSSICIAEHQSTVWSWLLLGRP